MSWNQEPPRDFSPWNSDTKPTQNNKYKGMVKVLPTQYSLNTQTSRAVSNQPTSPSYFLQNGHQNAQSNSMCNYNNIPKLPPPPKNSRATRHNVESPQPTFLNGQHHKSMHDLRYFEANPVSLQSSNLETSRGLHLSSQDLHQATTTVPQLARNNAVPVFPVIPAEPSRRPYQLQANNRPAEPKTGAAVPPTAGSEYNSLQCEMDDLKKELAAMKGPMQEHEEWLKTRSAEMKELEDLQKQIHATYNTITPKQAPISPKLPPQIPQPKSSDSSIPAKPQNLDLKSTLPKKDSRPPITSPKPNLQRPKSTPAPLSPPIPVSMNKTEVAPLKQDFNNNLNSPGNDSSVQLRRKSPPASAIASKSNHVKRISQLFEGNALRQEDYGTKQSNGVANQRPRSYDTRGKLSPALLNRIESIKLPEKPTSRLNLAAPAAAIDFPVIPRHVESPPTRFSEETESSGKGKQDFNRQSCTSTLSTKVVLDREKIKTYESKSSLTEMNMRTTPVPKPIPNEPCAALLKQAQPVVPSLSAKKPSPPSPPLKAKDIADEFGCVTSNNNPVHVEVVNSQLLQYQAGHHNIQQLSTKMAIPLNSDRENLQSVEKMGNTSFSTTPQPETPPIMHRYENYPYVLDADECSSASSFGSEHYSEQIKYRQKPIETTATTNHYYRYSNLPVDLSPEGHEDSNVNKEHTNTLSPPLNELSAESFTRTTNRKSIRPTQPPPPPPNDNHYVSSFKVDEASPVDNVSSLTTPQSDDLEVTVVPPPPPPELLPHLQTSQGGEGSSRTSSICSLSSSGSRESTSKTDLMAQIRQFNQSGRGLRKIHVIEERNGGSPKISRQNVIHAALQSRFQALHGDSSASSSEEDLHEDDDEWSA